MISELIQACNRSTQKLLDYAKEGDLRNCDLESKNRERIIKIIKEAYLKSGDRGKEFPSFVRESALRDAEILDLLQGTRKGLRETITSVYKIRKKIQRYHSDSV